MELDKRIKDITDIYSVTDGYHELFMDKKGYFADTIVKFKDLKKCIYGKYAGYNGEKDRCFLVEVEGESSLKQARYFIPEYMLKPEEKEYRPYTLKEFVSYYSLGDVIVMRPKVDTSSIRHKLFIEYVENDTGLVICLGGFYYSFNDLFKDFEIRTNEGWKPFGVEK